MDPETAVTRHPMFAFVPALLVALASLAPASAATTIQVGDSGRTFASSAAQCAVDPASGARRPHVQVGLFNPKPGARGVVSLNGAVLETLYADSPTMEVALVDGRNDVAVTISRKSTDLYRFTVAAGMCDPPDTSGNTFSADGTLEYAASGKSFLTVVPGCALNARTGLPQPFVNLLVNGAFLLNVSVNGQPLTQLDGRTRTHTAIFLVAGTNVITAANGTISIDAYLRDGGDGACALP